MKRFSIIVACMCLFFGFSAASAWAIWEGNAGIAAASEFPGKGMYARSDMFPKNTVVLIENLETGIKVRAVVTGSAGVSGLVAVLSPETAAALNVKSGSVSRVRISIPNAVSEKPSTGVSAPEGAAASTDPDVNPAVAAGAGAAVIPLASIAGSEENPLVPVTEAGVAPTDGEPSSSIAGSAPSETIAETPEGAPVAETAEVAETTEALGVTEIVPAAVPEGDMAGADEESSGLATAEDGADQAIAPADSSVPVADPEIAATPEEGITEGSSAYYDEPSLIASETPLAGEEGMSSELDSVALVPTDLNPPATAVPSSAPVAPVSSVAAPLESAPATPIVTPESLASVESLGAGYYVQLASYTDPVNVKKVIDTYGKRYPIVVERGTGARGATLKVCVGPVKKDEYGAIIERFKSLGFKDAFVRKGK